MSKIKLEKKDMPLVVLSRIAHKVRMFDGKQTAVGLIVAGTSLLLISSDITDNLALKVKNMAYDKLRKKYSINDNYWMYCTRKYIEVIEPIDF